MELVSVIPQTDGNVEVVRDHTETSEAYLKPKHSREWEVLIVKRLEGGSLLCIVVIGSRNPERMVGYVRCQVVKYQTCIKCGACAAVCPQNTIVVSTNSDIYEVDGERFLGCLKRVTHFGSTASISGGAQRRPLHAVVRQPARHTRFRRIWIHAAAGGIHLESS